MTFSGLLDSFRGLPALVVGDLMLDEYHFGRATRISPEAPVIVIRHEQTTHLPGGAANVALNLSALGASPTLIGVAGEDAGGDDLERCLSSSRFGSFELVREQGRRTTRKTRIVADHSHQVLRMDSEDDRPVDSTTVERVLSASYTALETCRVLVMSDYLKGVMSPELTRGLIDMAQQKGVPVVANPKPRSLPQYRGIDLISLNRLEAAEALGLHAGLSNEAAVGGAEDLLKRVGAKGLLLTLGEAGMVAIGGKVDPPLTYRVPAPKVEVYDTAGAGDTVIATAALGLAAAGFEREVFALAAQTAACVVRHVGVATPSPADLEAIRAMP